MAAWVVLALCITVDLSADLDQRPAIHLRIDQDGRLTRQQLGNVADELARIWRPAGVRLSWGMYADAVPDGSAIVSLRFTTVESPRDRNVLGWVQSDVREQPTPTLFICISGIRNLLSSVTGSKAVVVRERLTAQAMGRVAAHELGHYFIQGSSHDKRGLMRAVFSTSELLGPSLKPFQIPPEARRAFRAGIATLMVRRATNNLDRSSLILTIPYSPSRIASRLR